MNITPCISLGFDGQCEAAFRFYEQSLGGTIAGMFTYGNSPMADSVPPGWEAKIMHATLTIGGLAIAGADVTLYEAPKGFSIMLQMNEPADAERVFDALAEDGSIGMPLQETFWAARFGTVVDRFGVPWAINCEQAPQSAG